MKFKQKDGLVLKETTLLIKNYKLFKSFLSGFDGMEKLPNYSKETIIYFSDDSIFISKNVGRSTFKSRKILLKDIGGQYIGDTSFININNELRLYLIDYKPIINILDLIHKDEIKFIFKWCVDDDNNNNRMCLVSGDYILESVDEFNRKVSINMNTMDYKVCKLDRNKNLESKIDKKYVEEKSKDLNFILKINMKLDEYEKIKNYLKFSSNELLNISISKETKQIIFKDTSISTDAKDVSSYKILNNIVSYEYDISNIYDSINEDLIDKFNEEKYFISCMSFMTLSKAPSIDISIFDKFIQIDNNDDPIESFEIITKFMI